MILRSWLVVRGVLSLLVVRERLLSLAKVVLVQFSFQVQLLLSVKPFNLSLVALLLHLTFEGGVEMVLDVVISAPLEMLGYFRPSVAELLMKSKNLLVLLLSPFVLLNVGIQVVVPAFSALLTYTPRQELSDLRPILGSVLLDAFH